MIQCKLQCLDVGMFNLKIALCIFVLPLDDCGLSTRNYFEHL